VYISLQDGLLRLGQELIPNKMGHNFIFAKGLTSNIFTSFVDIDLLYEELSYSD